MGNIADKLVAAIASREKIRVKFGLAEDLPFSDYADNISVEGGPGDSTVQYGYVQEDGTIALLSLTGESPEVVGSMADYTAVIFNTGRPEPDYSINLEGVNVTADKLLANYVAVDASGSKVTGTIQTVEATSDGTTVTVPVGYIAVEQTFAVGGDAAVEYGYVTADGMVQMLDLSGETPINSGEPQTLDAALFVTGQSEPEYGTVSGGGAFDLAKVTEYVPYAEAESRITAVELSGFTDIIISDDPEDPDYEFNEYYNEANGRYVVTNATDAEISWMDRIYKHETKEYYLVYNYVEGSPSESTWFLCTAASVDSAVKWMYNLDENSEPVQAGNLADGTYRWGDYESEPFNITMTVTITATPEQPMVLKGVNAISYENEVWTFSDTETVFTGFETEPKVKSIYAVSGDRLIGAQIDRDVLFPDEGLVFYAPLEANVSTTETGQALTVNGGVTFGVENGVPCAQLNSDSDYIEFEETNFPTGVQPRTVSLWTKSIASNPSIFEYGQDAPGWFFSVLVQSGGSVILSLNSRSQQAATIEDASVWHHLVTTLNGTTVTGYVDGVFSKTGNFSYAPNTTLSGTGKIGVSNAGGRIAAVRVYNRVLTEEEITTLATEFAPTA